MEKQFVANTINDLDAVAKVILSELKEKNIFAISGKMGAGKTTLIKSFCNVLGVKEMVSSPTFALINQYTDANNRDVYHFDFYRIKKIEEVFDIGYEEYFYSDNYCFIEWPELVTGLLPDNHIKIAIRVVEDEKRIISYSV